MSERLLKRVQQIGHRIFGAEHDPNAPAWCVEAKAALKTYDLARGRSREGK